jgi:hypothetical protein
LAQTFRDLALAVRAGQVERYVPDPPEAIYAPLGHHDRTRIRWKLNRFADESDAERFKLIATNAAVALGHQRNSWAWTRWLDHLRGQTSVRKTPLAGSTVMRAVRFMPAGREQRERYSKISQKLILIADVVNVSCRVCQAIADADAIDGAVEFKTMAARSITELRRDSAFTFEELANRTKISVRQVKKHAAGDSIPSLKSAERYAAVFSSRLKRQIPASAFTS